ERDQPPLAPRPRRLLHMIIGGVEERLQLSPGQRPPLRPALITGDVRRGVPLPEHLHRHRPGALLALGHPPVAGIAHVLQEQRQRPPPSPPPVPLRACTRCINRSPSPTDLDATSCHPAQPGASNP